MFDWQKVLVTVVPAQPFVGAPKTSLPFLRPDVCSLRSSPFVVLFQGFSWNYKPAVKDRVRREAPRKRCGNPTVGIPLNRHN